MKINHGYLRHKFHGPFFVPQGLRRIKFARIISVFCPFYAALRRVNFYLIFIVIMLSLLWLPAKADLINKPLPGTLPNPAHPLSRGLVGCWFADGSKSAFDYSGNQNNGTFGDGADASTFPTLVPGRNGYAWRFDGGDYVNCGNAQSLNLSTELTILAWINPNGVSENGYILTKYSAVITGYSLQWAGSLDKVQFIYGDGTGIINKYSDGFTDSNVWVHIAVVKNIASNIYFYKNGVLAGSGTGVIIAPGTESVLLGNLTGGIYSSTFFNGLIDDVKIYNRALSQQEVRDLTMNSYCMFETTDD